MFPNFKPGMPLLIGSLAFFIRIGYLLTSQEDPTFFEPLIDSRTYHDLAVRLSQDNHLDEQFLWQGTFYPLFLTIVYKVFGVSIWAVKIIQAFLGALSSWLTVKLGSKIIDHRVGLVAGIIVALYGPLVFFEGQLLVTGWASLFILLIAVLATKWWPDFCPRDLVMFGAVSFFAILARPTFLIPVLALLSWRSMTCFLNGRYLFLLKGLGAFAVGLLVCLMPYTLWMKAQTGHSGVLPPSGGINLYIGNNPQFDETIKIRPGLGWEDLLVEPRNFGFPPDPWNGQQYFVNKVQSFWMSNPQVAIALLGEKSLQLITSRELPRTTDVYLHRQWSTMLSLLVFKVGNLGMPFGILFPLGLVGVWSQRKVISTPLILLILTYSLSVVLVFVSARYRVPLVPLIAIFGGAGILFLKEVFLARNYKQLLVASFLISFSALLTTFPGPFAQESIELDGEVFFGVGWNHYQREQWDEAEYFLRLALENDSSQPAANNFLGIVLANKGDFDLAIRHFQKALEIRPEYIEASRNLDKARIRGAVSIYTEGRELEQDDPTLALEIYHKAMEWHPTWPEPLARIAFLKSTCRVDSLRNGQEAFSIIQSPLIQPGMSDPYVLFVASTVYAECGYWDLANEAVERALFAARELKRADLEAVVLKAQGTIAQRKPVRF